MTCNQLPILCFAVLLLCVGHAIAETGNSVAAVNSLAQHEAPQITAKNVYDHEVYWPNIVALTERWMPPNAERPLERAAQGVLVRVEGDEMMRVDFGRHGKYDVPIGVSDLVERTRGVRAGTVHKTAPNFLRQIGTRLLDSRTESVRPLNSGELARADHFLVVFADPKRADFWALTDRLSALQSEYDLQEIFVPQSVDRGDTEAIKEMLQSNGWAVPFTYPRLSETYTRSLLGAAPASSYALLVTPEGRVRYRAVLTTPNVFDRIRAAIAE